MLGLGLGITSQRWLRRNELQSLINSLFGAGQQGAMFIPKPIVLGQQVLFQDAAGAVPVTADGDPVGRMLDISGRGNHASQPTSAARPLYAGLQHDGADDTLIADSPGMVDSTVFMLVKRTGDDRGILFGGNSSFGLVYDSGSSIKAVASGVTAYVDGVEVATRGETFNALTLNEWVIVKVQGLDLSVSDFQAIQPVGYRGNNDTTFHGNVSANVVICAESAAAAPNESSILNYLDGLRGAL